MKQLLAIICILIDILLFSNVLDKVDPIIFCEFPHLYSDTIEIMDSKMGYTEPVCSGKSAVQFNSTVRMSSDSVMDIIILGDPLYIADMIQDHVEITDSIITGHINLNMLDSILNSEALSYIWFSRPMFQSADSARFYSGVYQMNRTGYTGNNVTAAIIDNGMILNRDYILTGNRTANVWNQCNNRTAPPAGFIYGEELETSIINAYPIADSTGHGSALLSLLTSADSIDRGMLPYSDIVAVNAIPWEKNVIEGIKYISDKCDEEDRSFVLCLPMNHFWGRHDGLSPLDLVIDDYFSDFRSGRGIAVSAGNLGYANIHFSTIIDDTKDRGLLNNSHILFEKPVNCRFDADITGIDNLYFRFVFMENNEITHTEWILADSSGGGYCESDNFNIRYGLNSKWEHLHITVLNNEQMRFGMEFLSAGERDSISGYIAQGGIILTGSAEGQIMGDSKNTVAIPGLAKQAITSGAFVSRTSVPGIAGISDTLMHIPSWNPQGNYKYIKPDIYAPGKFIITDEVTPYWALFTLDNNRGVYSGTSIAAAITAGAMASVLGSDRLMYTRKLNRLMRTGAGDIPYNPGTGQVVEGYGYLDAYRSFLATRVEITESTVNYEITESRHLYIRISGIGSMLINVSKHNKTIPIVSNYMALDISPSIGNNIYQIIFEREERTFMIIDTFVLYQYSDSKEMGQKEALFDIAGRKISSESMTNGIYFIKDKSSESCRKFIYIK